MESLTDLIWSVEEPEPTASDNASTIQINCGGCVACCCSVPEIVTKWLCD